MTPIAYDSPELCTDRLTGSVENDVVHLRCLESGAELTLPLDALPSLVDFLDCAIASGRRRAFRVPVSSRENLRLTLLIKKNAYKAVAKDLSFIGVGIDCRQKHLPLDINDRCRIRIEYRQRVVEVAGIVKNRSERMIGIEFPSCLTGNEPTPPEDLRQIVQTLQLSYIRGIRAEEPSA